ncbi:MAG: cupin domain-containing protein [Candidatus Omnitrophica bacterium]|nr:cupin domain-containing protein [Candidatus Omnitrophota bacterium]MDD5771771.1 cupin domain-containing protein [Candidatus Omnitrophota bacterium]
MEIKVEKLGQEQLKQMGVFDWPVWKKEKSSFPWSYDCIEECYFLEGDVTVEPKGGNAVSFGKGDFVTFPKGMDCTWNIKTPVKKHYNFK